MKKIEFNTDGTLDLIEGFAIRKVPKIFNIPETEYEDVKVETKIYTDGEVVQIDEPIVEDISEYYINGKKYNGSINKLRTTRVQLKDHSYAVVYTLGEEYLTVGNIRGFFKVIKNVEIYLKDKKDLTALRKAKKTISMIQEHCNSVDYSSLFTMFLSKDNTPRKLEYEKYNRSVYTLKK